MFYYWIFTHRNIIQWSKHQHSSTKTVKFQIEYSDIFLVFLTLYTIDAHYAISIKGYDNLFISEFNYACAHIRDYYESYQDISYIAIGI